MISKPRIRSFLINTSLVFASTIFALFLVEMTLRHIVERPNKDVFSNKTPKAKYYGWTPPCNAEFISVNPDNGEYQTYRTNSECWRDVEHSFEKPADILRILFIGDSNTYGVVHFEEVYPRVVERLLKQKGLKNVEVISIGCGGWGTDTALEVLRCEGILYQPDFVVYQFCGNDLTDNFASYVNLNKVFSYEIRDGVLTRIDLSDRRAQRGFTLFDPLIPRETITFINNVRGALKAGFTKLDQPYYEAAAKHHHWEDDPIDPTAPYNYRQPDNDSDFIRNAWDLLCALLIEMDTISKKNNAEFIVFSEDGDGGKRAWNLRWERIFTDGNSDYVMWKGERYPIDFTLPLRRLSAICTEHGIPVIRPKRIYERFEYDAHPNARGNENMAQDIVEFLIDSTYIGERLWE